MSVFSFNGVDLTPFLTLLKIERSIGNDRDLKTEDGLKVGNHLQSVTFDAKKIKVRVSLKTRDITYSFVDTNESEEVEETNLNKLREKVAGLLHTDKPCRLLLPDEPDRYYLALPEGDIELEGISDWYDEAEITFNVPDGVSHAITYKRYDSTTQATVSNDRLSFQIVNDGSVEAYPIVTVKHTVENGYIGIVNTSGALEIGNREEADKVKVKQSELLFDYRDNGILSGFTNAEKNVGIANDDEVQSCVLNTQSVWDRQHVYLHKRNNRRGNHTGSLTWSIPADSNGEVGSLNDYIWWRQVFWLGAINQYGYIKVCVSDSDGRFLYGTETYKRSQGLECEYNFLASDGKGGYQILRNWTFKGTHEDGDNPFNHTRGFSDIKRNDDVVTVYWFGSYFETHVPAIKGKKSAKIHVFLGGIADKPLVTHMYLDGIIYRKDFVNTTKDIPNHFPSGTNVVINSEDDTVKINGIAKLNEVANGSDWLAIPPGSSTFEVYVSSFVRDKPQVLIDFEERWI